MPFVKTPGEMFRMLKTQKVLATEVRTGDIVLDQQGQVAHVDEIQRISPPDGAPPEIVEKFSFIEFAREVATYDGYERVVTFRIGAEVEIIDRSCLRHLSGNSGD
jgi:hypothetical protein